MPQTMMINQSVHSRGQINHLVQFYDSDGSLFDRVVQYILDGTLSGEAALVIVTSAHIDLLHKKMKARGLDVESLEERGQVVFLEAHETVAKVIVDGRPDEKNFDRVIIQTIKEIKKRYPVIRAFGEMVNVLFKSGNAVATIELEKLWSKAVKSEGFSLLCGYSTASLGEELSKRQLAENLLHESSAFKNAIFDSSLDCIKVLDLDSRLLFMNNGGLKTIEVDDFSEIADRRWVDFWNGDDRDAAEKAFAEAREGKVGEFMGYLPSLRTSLPKWWHVILTPIRDAKGSVTRILAVSRDVTDRKQSEDSANLLAKAGVVLASSLDYKQTLASIAQLVVASLADWCAVTLVENDELRTVAIAHKDPSKHAFVEEYRKRYEPRWDSGVGKTIKSGQAQLFTEITDEMIESAARDEHHLAMLRRVAMKSAMIVPLKTRDRTIGCISIFSTDSRRKYNTADLVTAEDLGLRASLAVENAVLYKESQKAVQLRDDFLSIASHELRTPITSLKLQLQMASRRLQGLKNAEADSEKLKNAFNVSMRQVDRLTTLLEDMLDASRIRAGRLFLSEEIVDVGGLINDVCERFKAQLAEANCQLEIRIEDEVETYWDKLRIEQVVVNLMSNIIKYAPDKPVTITVKKIGEVCRIIFKDNGPGIAKDKQKTIFDQFERANLKKGITGLGLGLFIVRQIVEAHKGKIEVQSEAGEGATFTVELPIR